MAVSITICNLALGDIRASAITAIGEGSLEAEMCERYYPHCLSLMLDDYTWQFTKRVAPLVLQEENERASEWGYCYALPADCGQALRLLPTGTAVSDFTTWRADFCTGPIPSWWLDFIVENNKLYAQVSDAVLEYASDASDESQFPPLFREGLRKLLAANLAIPIRNEVSLADGLFQQAERARQAAIAADMNRAPVHEPVDDVGRARRG